jgi:hypothetical protein
MQKPATDPAPGGHQWRPQQLQSRPSSGAPPTPGAAGWGPGTTVCPAQSQNTHNTHTHSTSHTTTTTTTTAEQPGSLWRLYASEGWKRGSEDSGCTRRAGHKPGVVGRGTGRSEGEREWREGPRRTYQQRARRQHCLLGDGQGAARQLPKGGPQLLTLCSYQNGAGKVRDAAAVLDNGML